MRKTKRFLAALAAMTMAVGSISLTSYAEDGKAETTSKEDTGVFDEAAKASLPTFVVIAADNYENVLLDNGCALYKSQYQKYLGSDTVLKYGDVIEIGYFSIQPSIPGQLSLGDGSNVKYIGTITELYKDDIKELTVAKSYKGLFTFTDSNGKEYIWGALANGYGMEDYGFVGKYDFDSINVGDKYECVVSGNDVVLPVSVVSKIKKAEATLKGDVDLNGTVDLADLTLLAKYNLSNASYPLANEVALANADMNGDGKVDALDTSALIENQLGREYTPEEINNAIELTKDLKPVSVQTARPDSKFDDSQTGFAVSLLKNTLLEDANTLVSPYSVVQAMAMTANGADGNTLSEIMNVIGGGADIDSFNKQMAGYRKEQPSSEGCKLLTANSIWYTNDTEKLVPDEEFLLTDKSYYDAQIFSAPLDNGTVKDVNSWVNKHTDGMIPSIIKEFNKNAVMTLVNAVTFDAKWMDPFYDSYDHKEFFTAADGTKQDAKIMGEMTEMPYLEDKEATGFMKYYEGGRYAFAAILPNEGTSVIDYVKGLTSEKLTNLFKTAKDQEVSMTMPKFSTKYDSSLSDQLKAMGIKDAFDLGSADFSKMGKSEIGGIYISDVIHKTFIDVTEKGTRAAAATAVEMAAGCAPIDDYKTVTLDRPFVYAIVDTQTNIPVFIGTLLTLE